MFYFFLFYFLLKNHKPALNLTIAPSQSTFQQGGAVNLTLTLKNEGDIPLSIDNRLLPGPDESFGQEITLLITGPGERPLPFSVLFQPSALEKSQVETLLPHQSISQSINLSNLFVFRDLGDYAVEVIYDTTKISSLVSFWRGRLVSSWVTFSLSGEKK